MFETNATAATASAACGHQAPATYGSGRFAVDEVTWIVAPLPCHEFQNGSFEPEGTPLADGSPRLEGDDLPFRDEPAFAKLAPEEEKAMRATNMRFQRRIAIQPGRGPRSDMTSATTAAPKHIPHAISRTTSIARNIAKRGLLAAFAKAATPIAAVNRGTKSFDAGLPGVLMSVRGETDISTASTDIELCGSPWRPGGRRSGWHQHSTKGSAIRRADRRAPGRPGRRSR